MNYRNELRKNTSETKAMQQKQHQNSELKDLSEDENDSNWSDWVDDELDIMCLFCECKTKDFANLKQHIKTKHNIDFDKESNNLTFYDRVKMVGVDFILLNLLCTT